MILLIHIIFLLSMLTALVLSRSEFVKIEEIKDEAPKSTSFQNLVTRIHKEIPHLKDYSFQEISDSFYTHAKSCWIQPNDLFEYFVSSFVQDSIVEMAKNPSVYLWNHHFPLFIQRKYPQWNAEEDNLLIRINETLKNQLNFGYITIYFPGRTGFQVYNRFRKLLEMKMITDYRKTETTETRTVDPITNRIFLPSAEKILSDHLKVLVSNGTHITRDLIRSCATEIYKCPFNLAERAVYQLFSYLNKEIYIDDKTYSDEFIEMEHNVEDLIRTAYEEDYRNENNDQYKEILQKFYLTEPVFSDGWLRLFAKRNHFSWRIAHFARRGAIDQEYVKEYLRLVAEAFCKYGEDLVFNMDETSVRINNGSTKSFVPINTKEVIVDAKRNAKECFTAIGTYNIKGCKPLILLTKGKTEASASKFRITDSTEVWETGNQQGWMNEAIMLKYLTHLHIKLAEGFPCALVLDCYKAHRTTEVKKLARKLRIELIFVPANGTGTYQPLDRRVFGIAKSILRSLSKNQILNDENRYSIVTNQLMRAWSRITPEHLLSAWSIPGLVEAYKKIQEEDSNEFVQHLMVEDSGLNDLYEEEEEDLDDSSDEDYR